MTRLNCLRNARCHIRSKNSPAASPPQRVKGQRVNLSPGRDETQRCCSCCRRCLSPGWMIAGSPVRCPRNRPGPHAGRRTHPSHLVHPGFLSILTPFPYMSRHIEHALSRRSLRIDAYGRRPPQVTFSTVTSRRFPLWTPRVDVTCVTSLSPLAAIPIPPVNGFSWQGARLASDRMQRPRTTTRLFADNCAPTKWNY